MRLLRPIYGFGQTMILGQGIIAAKLCKHSVELSKKLA
jgi:hypothetical protein